MARGCRSRFNARSIASTTAAFGCGSRPPKAPSPQIRSSSQFRRRSWHRQNLFAPTLPDKVEAAAGLPLGLDDKLFLSLDHAEEFDKDSRLFGRTDRVGTGAYHLRPFGRPQIEAYFGGTLARELEAGGERAFLISQCHELVKLLGSGFAAESNPSPCIAGVPIRLRAARTPTRGRAKADLRQVLAAPVDDRLFFAGEACSLHDFSTAHGGFPTGVAAADQVIAARRMLGS